MGASESWFVVYKEDQEFVYTFLREVHLHPTNLALRSRQWSFLVFLIISFCSDGGVFFDSFFLCGSSMYVCVCVLLLSFSSPHGEAPGLGFLY